MIDYMTCTLVRCRTAVQFVLTFIPALAMAIEEPKYTVTRKVGDVEILQYDPYIVAETVVDTSGFDEASNEHAAELKEWILKQGLKISGAPVIARPPLYSVLPPQQRGPHACGIV